MPGDVMAVWDGDSEYTGASSQRISFTVDYSINFWAALIPYSVLLAAVSAVPFGALILYRRMRPRQIQKPPLMGESTTPVKVSRPLSVTALMAFEVLRGISLLFLSFLNTRISLIIYTCIRELLAGQMDQPSIISCMVFYASLSLMAILGEAVWLGLLG